MTAGDNSNENKTLQSTVRQSTSAKSPEAMTVSADSENAANTKLGKLLNNFFIIITINSGCNIKNCKQINNSK